MSIFRFGKKRLTDDEYVARVRRGIDSCDRWRWWMILLHVGALASVFAMFALVMPRIFFGMAQQGNAPVVVFGFIFGAMLGMTLGWFTYSNIHGLLSAVSDYRKERLLIRCYDELVSDQSDLEPMTTAPIAADETRYRSLHDRQRPEN